MAFQKLKQLNNNYMTYKMVIWTFLVYIICNDINFRVQCL
jgi:hypothetical protein